MTENGTTRSVLRAAAFALVVFAAPALGAPGGHVPDEVLVRFRAGSTPARRGALHAAAGAGAVKAFDTVEGLQLVKLAPGTSMARALEQYGRSPDVLYVEPNYRLTLQAAPNDPGFIQGQLWGLDMYPIFEDADVDAPEAWDVATGSRDVVVTVIDTGIDYTHEDLAANMFRNEADCNANGVDDDGNGFADDCFGIDPISGDSDPMDEDNHGTHVAGTIGAVGGNGIGVVGVNWRVKLMPCKVFDATGNGSIAAAITCLDYVAMMKNRGVDIVATNNSWAHTNFSAGLRDAIEVQRQRGILFVAAAGNYAYCGDDPFNCRLDTDNDRKPTWPASYYLPNIIAVANSVQYGWLNAGSAYGRRTVHLAAPGTMILSTTPGNTYDTFTGTSMATPHVAGAAALLKAQNPARDWKAVKNLILAGTEGGMYPTGDSLITDSRLNARGSVACANQTVVSRLRPVPDAVTAVVGQPMELAVLHVNCAAPGGNVTVTVDPGGQAVTLRDDGGGIDQEAGDGIYSGRWTPPAQGQFSLTFPGADVVPVQVLAGTYGVAGVPFSGRTITGTPLTFIPLEPAAIESPFPLHFAGGSFTTLFVDERGGLQFDGGGFHHDLALYNEPLPSPYHSTLIVPYWDQIMEQPLADVVWEVTGTAPNRELVVEWRDMERTDRYCALYDGYVTFQVVFFEDRSDILFNYADATVGGECPDLDGGASATVGVQVAPDAATVFGFNAPVLADGTSLLWTLGGGPAPQPAIGVTPASADFGNVAVGASADVSFVVENVGTGMLVGQATTVAPFSVVSGGAYSLAAGQTQVVTARFSPTAAGTSLGAIAFTGGGGASRAVRGVGVDMAAHCDPAPRRDCYAPASKATLKVTDSPSAGKDRLQWQWTGTAAGIGDFGDPVTSTRYALCVYDGTELRAGFAVAPSALWRATSSGFTFRDRAGVQQGINSMKLWASLYGGSAKLQVKAGGVNLDGWLPALPLGRPTVQLSASDTGRCWSGTGTTAPVRSTETTLTDRCGNSGNPCARAPVGG